MTKAVRRKKSAVKRSAPPRPRRPQARRVLGERELEQALTRLNSSVRATVTRGEKVISAAQQIAVLAVERHRDHLLEALVNDGALSSLDGLVSHQSPEDSRLTRQVIVSWLRRHFDLESTYEPDQVLELPAGALAGMTVQGDISNDTFFTVRVIESGWHVNGRVLVPPSVVVVPAGWNS